MQRWRKTSFKRQHVPQLDGLRFVTRKHPQKKKDDKILRNTTTLLLYIVEDSVKHSWKKTEKKMLVKFIRAFLFRDGFVYLYSAA